MTKNYSVIVTGLTNTGKTTLCKYVSDSKETPSIRIRQSTIGADYNVYSSRGYRLNIWDADATYIDNIAETFYTKSNAVIAVYRPIDRLSYDCAIKILNRSRSKVRVLIANRYGKDDIDIDDRVKHNNILFFETNIGFDPGCVHKVFQDILTELIKLQPLEPVYVPTVESETESVSCGCIKKLITKLL